MVVRAAIYVAWADGQVQEEEKVMISKIGARLGMTPAHLSGVIESA
jgi:tellurite resistance protein